MAAQRSRHTRRIQVILPDCPCPRRLPCDKVATTRSRYGPRRSIVRASREGASIPDSVAAGQGAQRGRLLVQIADCELQPPWRNQTADSIARARKSSCARPTFMQEPMGAICDGAPPAEANVCEPCKFQSTLRVVHGDEDSFWMEAHQLLFVVIVSCGHDVDRGVLLVPVAGRAYVLRVAKDTAARTSWRSGRTQAVAGRIRNTPSAWPAQAAVYSRPRPPAFR